MNIQIISLTDLNRNFGRHFQIFQNVENRCIYILIKEGIYINGKLQIISDEL